MGSAVVKRVQAMARQKYYGVTLELAKESAAKRAARELAQGEFDAEMEAIVAEAHAENLIECLEELEADDTFCEICGKRNVAVEAGSIGTDSEHDFESVCADCSASWDDYCATEYAIAAAKDGRFADFMRDDRAFEVAKLIYASDWNVPVPGDSAEGKAREAAWFAACNIVDAIDSGRI
jgi:hypothetical protein